MLLQNDFPVDFYQPSGHRNSFMMSAMTKIGEIHYSRGNLHHKH